MVRKKNDQLKVKPQWECPKCLYEGTSTYDLISHDYSEHGEGSERGWIESRWFLPVAILILVVYFLILGYLGVF